MKKGRAKSGSGACFRKIALLSKHSNGQPLFWSISSAQIKDVSLENCEKSENLERR